MERAIGEIELRELLEDRVQLVEVMPRKEYAAGHLPGAVNIPLRALEDEAPLGLDFLCPTVVYCADDL